MGVERLIGGTLVAKCASILREWRTSGRRNARAASFSVVVVVAAIYAASPASARPTWQVAYRLQEVNTPALTTYNDGVAAFDQSYSGVTVINDDLQPGIVPLSVGPIATSFVQGANGQAWVG